jgi:hypothetical protein
MGIVVSMFRSIPIEQQGIIHNVYLRAPTVEMTYDAMTEKGKGTEFYPMQMVFSIASGHTTWEGLLDGMFKAYKIDESTVQGMYWSVWVTKHIPTFAEDSGERYTAHSKIINDRTEAKVLAGYIIDGEWDFYFTLESRPMTGFFVNSPTPPQNSYLRPTESELLSHKQTGSV